MKHIVIVYGCGIGCDYGVGCNIAIHKLNAETMDEAIAEVSNYEGDEGDICTYYGDGNVANCEIIGISNSVDFLEIHDNAQRKIDETCNREEEEEIVVSRKALYEELKKEFEGK